MTTDWAAVILTVCCFTALLIWNLILAAKIHLLQGQIDAIADYLTQIGERRSRP